MTPFAYRRPDTVSAAAELLAAPGALPLGGGTDLLVQIDEGITRPDSVVDLRGVEALRSLEWSEDSSLRIGGAVSIESIARDPRVRSDLAALAQACSAAATPALRTMGTLGGNICQRPRCWYLRRAVPCYKNGGSFCAARDGENQYHAILDGGPCYIVHPSDPAVALTALEAEVEITSTSGSRVIPISRFYVLPRDRLDSETVLQPGEFVSAVIVPSNSSGGTQLYKKLMQRATWDFALASIAAVRRADGDVRLVLGGVAPRPWRVNQSVEEDVASGGLDEDSISALASRALYDAEPLARNAYKINLAEALLRDGIGFLSGSENP